MSSAELIRLDAPARPVRVSEFVETIPLSSCVFITSGFRRLREVVRYAAAIQKHIRIIDAAAEGEMAKNWFALGDRILDLATAGQAPILVLLDEPKALFEGADKMSQGLQVALDGMRHQGWTCSWQAVSDPSADLQALAYQRMAEWLTRGVPMSRDLLAFCAVEDGAPPDEHALDVMASKGDWNNRFGQVRLLASRAFLSCVRDVLDLADESAIALLAIAIIVDGLHRADLAPGRGGWGDNKQTLEGWSKARMTEAALVYLWIDGRLPDGADARLHAMLDRSTAIAFTLGLFVREDGSKNDRDKRSRFLRARTAMRRWEEMLRSCRNRLAHPKGAPPGSYQLVGAILVAAEAWAAGVAPSLGPEISFPDEWPHWTEWQESDVNRSVQELEVSKGWKKRDLVEALASLKRGHDINGAATAFAAAGGGLAKLSRTGVERLLDDCFGATALTW